MRRSVIDIGTNTMLMLIAEFNDQNNQLKTLLDIQRVPRLGKGVDADKNILPESFGNAIDVLLEYVDISSKFGCKSVTATATSFIRDAKNRDEFISRMKDETGINIEILSGVDEAKWTFIGGVYDKLKSGSENKSVTVIDIGGGSTEISTGIFEGFSELKDLSVSAKSLDVGSVRLNEKFLGKHPPNFESIVNAEQFVTELLVQAFQSEKFDKSSDLIGVAGTITTLAAIKHGLNKFNADLVDGTVLYLDEIESIFARLASMPLEELYAIGDYMEGRADIIIPGILILKTFMERFGFDKITVSAKGLRYGIFLREQFKIQSS